MQVLMSPFRFAGQWAMFPILLMVSLGVGAGIGAAYGWATDQADVSPPIIVALLSSPLPITMALVLLGLTTNSWTIAIIVGASTAIAALAGQKLAEMALTGQRTFDPVDVISELPVALLAGGALGLAGCLWHHEGGTLRAIGAAIAAGVCGWIAWRNLEPVGFAVEVNQFVGWTAVALTIGLLLRSGLSGSLLLALVGAATIATLLTVLGNDESLNLRRFVETLLDEARRWQSDLIGQTATGRYE